MSILVDTTPLVALCNDRDALHETAWQHLKTLGSGPFAVCEPTVSEALFLLRSRPHRQRLQRLVLNEMNMNLLCSSDSRRFLTELFDWLARYADHAPDWADACIAVLSGHDKRLKVWTYDSEFRTIWRRPDGSVIPMAVK